MNAVDCIKQRQTIKNLSDTPNNCNPIDNELIETLMQSAYWAPFHKPCEPRHQSELNSILPFRFYVLDAKNCRNLADYIKENGRAIGKVGPILNAADYLVQATWLPNAPQKELADGVLFEANIANMEHIAAASCAIQNILLTATDLGLDCYWSSGSVVLREDDIFKLIGISDKEILLGSLYIKLKNINSDPTERVGSKLRNKRNDYHNMYKIVDI